MTALDIDACMQNTGLIRHRAKLEAIVKNAKAYLEMEKCGENFSDFVWSFVNHKSIVNDVPDFRSVPAKTEASKALSKALKKTWFRLCWRNHVLCVYAIYGIGGRSLNDCPCKTR